MSSTKSDQYVKEQFEFLLIGVINILQDLNNYEFHCTCLMPDFCEIQVDQHFCKATGFVWVYDNDIIL